MVWKAPYISTTGRMALSARWTFPYQEVLAIDKLLSDRRVLVVENEMLLLIMIEDMQTDLDDFVQADPPTEAQRDNCLPGPEGVGFSLFMHAYWPTTAVTDGSWTPPVVQKVN
jgi:hypothetical protein